LTRPLREQIFSGNQEVQLFKKERRRLQNKLALNENESFLTFINSKGPVCGIDNWYNFYATPANSSLPLFFLIVLFLVEY
jgi:hypothetical protein